jgi:hypothetical protein
MAAIAAGGLSALTLTSGLMIAGGALTGIGALTGNKKLMTLGSVLGLAGGVSSFVSKAGEAAGAAATAEAASQAAAEAGASTTANVGGNVVQGAGADLATTAADTAANIASEAGSSALAGSQPGGLIADAAPPGALTGDVGPWEAGPLADAGPGMSSPGATPPVTESGAANYRLRPGSWEQNTPNNGSGFQARGQSFMDANASPVGAGGGMARSAPPSLMGQQAFMDANASPVGAGEAVPGMGTSMPSSSPINATQYDLQRGTYGDGYSGRGPESIPGQAGSAAPGDWWSKMKKFGQDFDKFTKENPGLTKVGGGLLQGAMTYAGNQQMASDNVKRQMAYQDWVRQKYSDSLLNLTVPSAVRTASASGGIIGGVRG